MLINESLLHVSFLVLFFGILNPNQAQNTSFENISTLSKSAINDISLDQNGRLWIASEQGLINLSFDKLKNKFQHQVVIKKGVSQLHIDKNNQKYLANYEGEIFKEDSQGVFQPYSTVPQSNSIITDLKQDKNEALWVATFGDGLWLLNKKGQKTQFKSKNSKLLSDKIFALYLDKQQTTWIATNKGLCTYSARKKWDKFNYIKQATAICEYGNSLWVAGSNQNGKNVIFHYQGFKKWKQIKLPETLNYGRITAIAFDNQGKLWLTSHVLASYGIDGWTIYDKQNGFESRSALCILLEAGNIWVGTEGKGLLAKIQNKNSLNSDDNSQNTLANFDKQQLLKKDSSKLFKIDFKIPQRLDVKFERSKSVLKSAYYADLDRLVETLLKNPALKIQLAGHTDNIGNPILNRKLSKQRAESVKKYLVEKGGVQTDKIQIVAYGGSRPIAINTKESKRKKNRRVEVLFIQ